MRNGECGARRSCRQNCARIAGPRPPAPPLLWRGSSGRGDGPGAHPSLYEPSQLTVTATAVDGMPLATTTSSPAPVSIPDGTSKFVDTVVDPVATPIVL